MQKHIPKTMASVICQSCGEVLIPRYRQRLSDLGDPVYVCPRCGGHGYNRLLFEAALLSPAELSRRKKRDTLRISAVLLVFAFFLCTAFFPAKLLPVFLLGAAALIYKAKPWDLSDQVEESMTRLLQHEGRAEELESLGQPCQEGSAWEQYRKSKDSAEQS